MRMQFKAILAAFAVLPMVATADETPEAVSPDFVYVTDTLPSPRTFKTPEEAAVRPVTCRAGETVTLTAPNGTVTTLVADAPSDTTATMTVSAGGLWTVENSEQGTATFLMRYSYYGTQGAGTAEAPAKLVDGDELADLMDAGTAGDGYVFTLEGNEASLLDALQVPAGYCLQRAGDSAWRIVSSDDGCEFVGEAVVFMADAKQKGPNRRVKRGSIPPVAYSGDDWAGDESADSTLTLRSPRGVNSVFNLTGTGAYAFSPWEVGSWTVTLTTASGTQTATVDVTGGFIMIVW